MGASMESTSLVFCTFCFTREKGAVLCGGNTGDPRLYEDLTSNTGRFDHKRLYAPVQPMESDFIVFLKQYRQDEYLHTNTTQTDLQGPP